jgi:predicted metal-dependent RNase
VKYRELLKLCNEKPGCIKTKEQMEADRIIKHLNWAAKIEKEYEAEKERNNT